MKKDIVIIQGCLLLIVGFICTFGALMCLDYFVGKIPKALECPQNDITTFELHPVTFVIADMQLHIWDTQLRPRTDMRIRIACANKSTHNYTTMDGSCSFLLEGSTEYTVTIENEHLESEKQFVLYPINSCYLIVLERKERVF